MPDTETEALLAIHVMAHAIPGSESCECRMTAEQDFTCGYCRFVAAGIYDHLIDSGYRIVRAALIDGSDADDTALRAIFGDPVEGRDFDRTEPGTGP